MRYQQATVNEHGLWIFQPRCRQALRAHNAVGMYPDPDGIASSSSIVPVDCITVCQRQAALLSSGWHRQATSLLVLHTTSGALYRYDLARQPSYHRPSAAAAAVPADSDNVLAPNTSVSTAPSGTASRRSRAVLQLRAQLHSPLSCPSADCLLLRSALRSCFLLSLLISVCLGLSAVVAAASISIGDVAVALTVVIASASTDIATSAVATTVTAAGGGAVFLTSLLSSGLMISYTRC